MVILIASADRCLPNGGEHSCTVPEHAREHVDVIVPTTPNAPHPLYLSGALRMNFMLTSVLLKLRSSRECRSQICSMTVL